MSSTTGNNSVANERSHSAGNGGGGGGGGGGRADAESQQYCLRWNNHRSNLLTVFEQLLQTEAFTDVTLAVNGTSIKCHKMVLAACSSYFQSLFLENACPHPIVVFKDIQYAEIRAILEYMYRGEVNVAQEQLPSLLKVAEALRVKGLFEDDSVTGHNSGQANAHVASSSRFLSSEPPALTPVDPSNRSTTPTGARVNRSASKGRASSESPAPPPSPPVPPAPHVQLTASDAQNLLYTRHPYLYKSPLLSPNANSNDQQANNSNSNPLSSMWPPLVMPLHLGAFENALREREQALALYGLQRDRDKDGHNDKDHQTSGNGRDHDLPSGGSGSSIGSNGTKRKRLSSNAHNDVDAAPSLLRTVLGPHLKGHDLPGLFPFRLGAEGSSADDRTHLAYLPGMLAYAERQASRDRDRDDDWPHNPDMNSEDDPGEISGDYGHAVPSSPLSEKRVDPSGARIAAYVPTQKLEWKRYKQYTNSDIQAAIEAVKSGMSALQASRKFKVPSRTLYDKVKKLGIATTRPYSRVSSSAASAAAAAAAAMANQANQVTGLSNFAASTAALTSAMAAAASALSLVKRERGPVIQVAGSSSGNGGSDANDHETASSLHSDENSRQDAPENLTLSGGSNNSSPPANGKSSDSPINVKNEPMDKRGRSSPAFSTSSYGSAGGNGGGANSRSYFAVRDDLNASATAADSVADKRPTASPNPT